MRGHPRMKPPFPAVSGLYACPTVVNNVETLTAVPDIIKMGGEAIRNWELKRAVAQSSGQSPVMSIVPAFTNCRWAMTTWKSSSWKTAAGC